MTNEQLGVTLRGYADRLYIELERVDDNLDAGCDGGFERHVLSVPRMRFNEDLSGGEIEVEQTYDNAVLLDSLLAIIDEIENVAGILLDKG